jgi:secreted trypsin-like serine protease
MNITLFSKGSSSLVALMAASSLLILSACGKNKSYDSEYLLGNDQAILGGSSVESADVISKSTVALISLSELGGTSICTGTLITKRLVLTAAHCVIDDTASQLNGTITPYSRIIAKFGVDMTENDSSKIVSAIDLRVHGDYLNGLTSAEMPKANWGDIAILKLAKDAPLGFNPAKILNNANILTEGQTVTLAGFGVTQMNPERVQAKNLMKVEVKIQNAKFSETEITMSSGPAGACHGDSGGPAFTKDSKGQLVVFGVTSRSVTQEGGSTCTDGSIYTSIPAQIDWIRKAVASLAKVSKPAAR